MRPEFQGIEIGDRVGGTEMQKNFGYGSHLGTTSGTAWGANQGLAGINPRIHRAPVWGSGPRGGRSIWQVLSAQPGISRLETGVKTAEFPQVDAIAQEDEPIELRQRRVEAVLLMAREPVSSRKLAQWTGLADTTEARTLTRRLNEQYDQNGRSMRVEEVAGGFQLRTRPQFAKWLRRLDFVPGEQRLTPPSLETLAIVAYRQPILRAELEAIRGVGCGEVLRQLMQRDLVRICGRSEDLGRPYLYGTTTRFLQLFGLPSLEKLPRLEKVRELDQMLASHRMKSSSLVTTDVLGSPGFLEGSETKESIVKMKVAANGLNETLDELLDPRLSRQLETFPVMASDEDEEFEDDEEEEDDFEDDEEEEFEDEEADEEFDDEEDDSEEEEFDEEELEDAEEEEDEWEEVEGEEEDEEDEEDEDWSDDEDDDWDDDDDEEEEDEDEDWE